MSKHLQELRALLEWIEIAEGACYRNRAECSAACPLWYAGAFDDDVCLPRVLGHRLGRMIHDRALPKQEGSRK